jgi:2-keto-4-pentenoate hydratase/2-oxohepta-3-ene-1,7-dioic acid hydratase in catechol pathway
VKLCSYQVGGKNQYGVMIDEGIIDLSCRIGRDYPTLVSLISGQAITIAQEAAAGVSPDFGLDSVTFLPLTAEPVNIFCVGVNYMDHRAETGRTEDQFPSAFAKFQESLVGHNELLVRPRGQVSMDFEVEYAVVIGQLARNVSVEDALDYVVGYTILNDGTIREYQYERSVFQGKNFWHTGACGPCMLTRDAAPDWADTFVETRLNGGIMQRSGVDQLIMDVPFLVSYFSRQTLLKPGDIIATGTPAGVGHRREPPLYLKPGDTLEMEITGIGVLRNTVIDEVELMASPG